MNQGRKAVLKSKYHPLFQFTSKRRGATPYEPYKKTRRGHFWRPVPRYKTYRGRTYKCNWTSLPGKIRWIDITYIHYRNHTYRIDTYALPVRVHWIKITSHPEHQRYLRHPDDSSLTDISYSN